MKTSRAFTLFTAALIIGFLAARWTIAQPGAQAASTVIAPYDNYALHQLESFVTYLHDAKQTNVLERFNDYSSARMASETSANMAVNTAILMRLRDGRTNEAINLLELRLTSDVVGFVASYRELPASVRETVSLTPLKIAHDYCSEFHVKQGQPDLDAFKLLDEKATK